jgi:4-hydroxy-3-methylbut-2-enyl diphosphate reductase
MRQFDIPLRFQSPWITKIKQKRKLQDPKKKDFSPTLLDLGDVSVALARHFGFCYGVENAIEIAYTALKENPGKRVFLLSQLIHNPLVNADLQENGISFVQDTEGNLLMNWEDLSCEDILVIPAFGTTLETEEKIKTLGLKTKVYDSTCPFVEKVWKKSEKLAEQDYTVIIHGKAKHEETKATFSHTQAYTKAVIIKDMQEAKQLLAYILHEKPAELFFEEFAGKYSQGFDPAIDLAKIGVVNQTTMLAEETQAIADFFKQSLLEKHGQNYTQYFADTRDTLCYATNDNQTATYALLETDLDVIFIVGGYNSSNTSHLVELCEKKCPSYFIESASCLQSLQSIVHYDMHQKITKNSINYLPAHRPLRIAVTAGASCPDAEVERVLRTLVDFLKPSIDINTCVETI